MRTRSQEEGRCASALAHSAARVTFALAALLAAVSACGRYAPRPLAEVAFRDRALEQSEDGVRVEAAVPSPKESERIFGVPVAARDVQPVWLRIENDEDIDYVFLPASIDPDYFSPQEVAWTNRFAFDAGANRRMAEVFERNSLPLLVPSGGAIEGFVHTHLDPGVKYSTVILFHPGRTKELHFVIDVPGIEADYHRVDFAEILAAGTIPVDDPAELRRALEALPCCVLGPDGKTPGDPLNLVVIGNGDETLFPFLRQGWDLTETLSGGSVWRTIASSLFGVRYRTSPVSPLFVFGRAQDIALQTARRTVDERNHLRLWLSPLLYDGRNVWVGQVSRDIGVRLSSQTLVTHKIDPDVDEARDYVTQDLLLSGSLGQIGWVDGVGAVTPAEPRRNYTGDPYWTDGDRVVLGLDEEQDDGELEFFDWPDDDGGPEHSSGENPDFR